MFCVPVALLIWVIWCRPSELFGLRPRGFCLRPGIRVARLKKGVMAMIGLGFAAGSGMVDFWFGISFSVARVMPFQFFRVWKRSKQARNFQS